MENEVKGVSTYMRYLFCAALFIFLLSTYGRHSATPRQIKFSAHGTFSAELVDDVNDPAFAHILITEQKPINGFYECVLTEDRFKKSFTLILGWDEDTLWIYSADSGLYFWDRTTNWMKHTYTNQMSAPIPKFITSKEPNLEKWVKESRAE